MATLKLTKSAIKKFAYEGRELKEGYSRDVRWDTTVPGFGVRVYPSGHKAYVLSYRVKGRKRLEVLGSCQVLTLDQAREKAKKDLVKAGDHIDPLEEKRSAGRGKTFGDLIGDFMTRHVEAQGLKTARDIRKRLDRNIPASWKSRHADAIEAWEIEALHQRIGKADGKPYEANRTLELLRVMFRHASRWKYLAPAAPNPTDGIAKFKQRERKRWARPEEVRAIIAALDDEPNIFVRALIWLYLLTGVRKSELRQARWNDIDWTRGMLRLSETKAGQEQEVALSAPALAIIQALPRLEGNPYLFPGAKKGRHFVNIDKRWHRIRSRATVMLLSERDDPQVAGLIARLTEQLGRTPTIEEAQATAVRQGLALPTGVMDLRLHDIRRSVGSWLTQDGVDLNVVKTALRHSKIGTTLIYARLGSDAAREAMEAHGQRILEAAGKRGPVEVVKGGGAD